MKVLLISKGARIGGAAVAARRLLETLRDQKVEARMLVQENGDPETAIFDTGSGFIKRGLNLARFILERLTYLPREKDKSFRFKFSPANTGENLSRNPLVKEADILHLHWINAGFISLRSLQRLLSLGKPVVWTFHDMWAFTGGCHVALDCRKFTVECGQCPYIKRPGERDLSNRIWRRKKRIFKNANVTVITPSQWLNDQVRSSSLLGHWDVQTIHNPVDQNQFKPAIRESACHRLGLDPLKKYILFGATTVKDTFKGYSYFLEATEILNKDLGADNNVEILLFGKTTDEDSGLFPMKTRNISFIKSTPTMVDVYSVAHLFAIPSLIDNLPNTIMESMLCGTPVVGFRTGGIPEMIGHKRDGYLADYRSVQDLADGMKWVLMSESYDALSAEARKAAIKRFPRKQAAEKYIELYRKLLEKPVSK